MDGEAVEALFDAAVEVPTEERAAFVRARCGGDEALYAEVMELLSADAEDGPWPIEPASLTSPFGLSYGPGDRVGRYEILEKIGQGGFAVVYLAQQVEPVRRRVALKTIKPGMETELVLSRFEAESQALALMEHPNIAEVLDAGATERGSPYFVMEHVEGTPITDHCASYRLGLDERLELFMQCCEAVQHAHLKAVIHRDLKPSNILVRRVEGRSVPKIIDFGVAKALEQKLTPDTIQTAGGVLVGTPGYMSPEQLSLDARRRVDTRVDVYALGVVLYELLTGEMPYEAVLPGEASLTELLRAVREVDTPRPSTRLPRRTRESAPGSGVGRRPVSDISAHQLSGDLDWIVLKALEKEPGRRYGSPRELAEDIERYRANEPVRARPPSAAYRASKFLRRNAGSVAAGVVASMFLVVLAGSAAMQAHRDRRARRELAQVVDFQAKRFDDIDPERMGEQLRRDLLAQARARGGGSGPGQDDGGEMALLERTLEKTNFTTLAAAAIERHVFEPALAMVDAEFDEQPEVKARLLQSLVEEMRTAGLFSAAAAAQEEALAIRRRVLGDKHPVTLESIDAMGVLLYEQRELEEAEAFFREALAGRLEVLGDEHPATLDSFANLGVVLRLRGKPSEAESFYRAALEGRRKVLGDRHPDTIGAVGNLGLLLKYLGRHAEAERLHVEALEGMRRTLGEEHPHTLSMRSNLGALLMKQGRFAEAERQLRSALEGRRTNLGDEHPRTLGSLHLLGSLYLDQGEYVKAEPFMRQCLEGRRRVLGDDNPATLATLNKMGVMMAMQGRFSEAESYYRRALKGGREVWNGAARDFLATTRNLASVLNAQKRYAESERILRETQADRVRVLGDGHWKTAEARSLLGEAMVGLGRHAEAVPLLLEAHDQLEASLYDGRRQEKLDASARRLEQLYEGWDKPEGAARWGHAKRTSASMRKPGGVSPLGNTRVSPSRATSSSTAPRTSTSRSFRR